MEMATETKSVEWIEERTLVKIVNLKVATVSWECGANGEGCTMTYSSPVVFRQHRYPRNVKHFVKSSASWLWAYAAVLAAIFALIAFNDGSTISGIGTAGWLVIATTSVGVSIVAAILLGFDEKYKVGKPLPVVQPTRRFDVTLKVSRNCTQELARLWADLLQR